MLLFFVWYYAAIALLLALGIGLSLFFLVHSTTWIVASTQSSVLVSPLPPSILEIMSSLWRIVTIIFAVVVVIVISPGFFLYVWAHTHVWIGKIYASFKQLWLSGILIPKNNKTKQNKTIKETYTRKTRTHVLIYIYIYIYIYMCVYINTRCVWEYAF